MRISSLNIKNYRGLDINVDSIEKVTILIGQNDSGKNKCMFCNIKSVRL